MTKPMKAALLSALVFPGLGHFAVKKKMLGAALAGISIVCLYAIVSTAVMITQSLMSKIMSGEVPADINTIQNAVTQQILDSGGLGDSGLGHYSMVLAICWFVGIVDSYRIGRAQEAAEAPK